MFRSTAMILALFGSLVFSAGCGGGEEEGLGTCPPDSTVQQADGKMVIDNNCLNCHGDPTNGPPATATFNDETVVTNSKDAIYARVTDGTMPPSGMLGAEAIDDLRVYLSCLQ